MAREALTLILFATLLGCPVGRDNDDDDSSLLGDDDTALDDDDSAVGDDDSAVGDDDDDDDDDDTSPAVPLAGFGDITGDCGVIDDELDSIEPSYFSNVVDFGATVYADELLSAGGQEVIADGNLGGSSLHSEAISYDVLYRCELATLIKTEGEIDYLDVGGKKTDLLVEIDGERVGVSVTRAYGWPPEDPYTVEQARYLLEGKLADVLLSSANVSPADAWVKQILHVVAYTPQHAESMQAAWAQVDAAVRADTLLVVTATEGADGFIYE